MSVLGHLILAVAKIIDLLVGIYTFMVAIAVILSWVRPDPTNPIVAVLRQTTGPAFRLARRLMPRFLFRTGIDFSPLLVFLLLIFIQTFLVGVLNDLAGTLLVKPR